MLTRNPSPPPRIRHARSSIERLTAREIKTRREALLAHFERRQRRLEVVATTRTVHGHVLDWVPVESQIPGGVIAAPPPDRPRRELGRTRRAKLATPVLALRDAKLGPPGTVPIARPNLRRLPAVSLAQFLSKHGHDVITAQLSNGLSIELPEDAPSPHLYAASAQRAICFGGEAWLSANPTWVEWSNEFGLMQTSLSNDESGSSRPAKRAFKSTRICTATGYHISSSSIRLTAIARTATTRGATTPTCGAGYRSTIRSFRRRPFRP